jgi:aryl-alcohol dehydrogenase
MRQIKAATIRQKGGPFQIENLMLDEPRLDEVLVRVVATGMCHTDMVARDQLYEVPLPIVLGHEGAGVVEQVGDSVKKLAAGDHVVLTYMWCGHCKPCLRRDLTYCENLYALNFGGAREDGSTSTFETVGEHEAQETHNRGRRIHAHFFGQSTFGTYALANERNVVKVPKEASLELLGPLGCGIQTGAGAVMNALKVRPGTSFATFGGGAVGLSAVMAARVAGATTIIAADVVPSRLELAKELGATHIVSSRETDPVVAVREISGEGADYTLESSGRPEVLRQAIDALAIGAFAASWARLRLEPKRVSM